MMDNFPPWSNSKQINSNINTRFLWSYTHWMCYLATNGIYYFYSLLVISEIPSNIFFYGQTFQRLPATVTYFFKQL